MFFMTNSLNSFPNIFLREKKKKEKNWKVLFKFRMERDVKQ